MCADAPNTSGVNKAAKMSAQTASDALAWFTAEAERTQAQRDKSVEIQQAVAQGQLDTMAQQNKIAADYDTYRKTTFQPLEQQIVDEAKAYDTEGRREAAADAATADVRAATNRAIGSTTRTMARMGYNPSFNATKMAQQAALAEAGAATGARRTVEATGRAMRMDAASLGRGLSSAQATAISTGTAAGGTASGAAGAANATNMSGASLMGQGFNTALSGYGQSGSLYAQQANIQGQYGGMDLAGLGKLGQGAAALWTASDENVKSGTGKIMSGRSARMAIEKLPVHEGWRYDPAKGGPDDGGVPHDGPMAQDVREHMPEAANGEGTAIDQLTIQGNLIAAVADISKEVRRISARMEGTGRETKPARPRSLARMGGV